MKKIITLISMLALVMSLSVASAAEQDKDAVQKFLQEEGTGPAGVLHSTDVVKSPYYSQLDFYYLQSNEQGLIMLPRYETKQQESEYTCGPAAAWTVVKYLKGVARDDEMTMAALMGTGKTGTDTRQMSSYFTTKGYLVHNSLQDGSPQDYEAFLAFVDANLKRGVPVMVENIDWGGHWRVIIGHDTMNDANPLNDVLIMADPYDMTDHNQDGYNVVPACRFFYTWFDVNLFKDGEKDKQWLTAEIAK